MARKKFIETLTAAVLVLFLAACRAHQPTAAAVNTAAELHKITLQNKSYYYTDTIKIYTDTTAAALAAPLATANAAAAKKSAKINTIIVRTGRYNFNDTTATAVHDSMKYSVVNVPYNQIVSAKKSKGYKSVAIVCSLGFLIIAFIIWLRR